MISFKTSKLLLLMPLLTPWLAFSLPFSDFCDEEIIEHGNGYEINYVNCDLTAYNNAIDQASGMNWVKSRGKVDSVNFTLDNPIHSVWNINNTQQAHVYYHLNCPQSYHCGVVRKLMFRSFTSIPSEVKTKLFQASVE